MPVCLGCPFKNRSTNGEKPLLKPPSANLLINYIMKRKFRQVVLHDFFHFFLFFLKNFSELPFLHFERQFPVRYPLLYTRIRARTRAERVFIWKKKKAKHPFHSVAFFLQIRYNIAEQKTFRRNYYALSYNERNVCKSVRGKIRRRRV